MEIGILIRNSKNKIDFLEIERINNQFLSKSKEVAIIAPKLIKTKPVLFFNISTRISTVSQNAGFSLLSAWCLRLAGYSVVHVVCKSAINCLFNPEHNLDICNKCIGLSEKLFSGAQVEYISPENSGTHQNKEAKLNNLGLKQLIEFQSDGLPLGKLVYPSVRWITRKFTLDETENTLETFRNYILSAWYLQNKFNDIIEKYNPQAIVLFNGTFSPEVIFREIAKLKGIRVITHEVGLQPMTAYLTDGLATDYPMQIPDHFELSSAQNELIDSYLYKRFTGSFSMAGISFWPKIKPIDYKIKKKINKYSQCITIFTNVIFDTSQTHANVIFENMFDWLNKLIPVIQQNNDTLFIIRAHPDETRPGKTSKQQVSHWYSINQLQRIKNLIFIGPDNYISSYQLIDKSKFILIYNSTIGLEASILGKPVLCAAKSRFTEHKTVIYPESNQEYFNTLNQLLQFPNIDVNDYSINAKRLLFFQIYKYSLPFSEYLYPLNDIPGHVGLSEFPIIRLKYENSILAKIIVDGIIHGKEFILSDEDIK
jgi:hypothetical protein